MTLAERRLNDKRKIKQLEKELRTSHIRNKEKTDLIAGLVNENEVLNSDLNKWIKKQEDGYSWVAINDYIVAGGTVLPHSTFIFTQDIPDDIENGYYKLEEGTIVKDIQKYNRYIGGL